MSRRTRRSRATAKSLDSSHRSPWTAIVYSAALALAVVLAFGRGVQTPFIFDDIPGIANNWSIRHLWPLVGSFPDYGPLSPPKLIPASGRPLVNLSFALNYQFGGLDPAGYHVFNLVLHWLSALLLMAIVQRTLCLEFFHGRFVDAAQVLGFLAALLWAVHPLQTETVVYITQRTELMVGFFYFALFYCALRYWTAPGESGKHTWLALAILASLAGMACKEVMVTAPVLVLLFHRTFIAGSLMQALRQTPRLYVGLLASWILLLLLNYDAPRAESAGFHLGISACVWWFTQAKLLCVYLKLLVWPSPLHIRYLTPYIKTFAEAWPWLLIVAALILATIVLLWRRRSAGFVGAWVFLILSPTMIVPIVTEVGAERRMYLPTAAIATLFITLLYTLAEKVASRSARNVRASRRIVNVAVPAGLLVIVWSFLDIHRISAYNSHASLWQEDVDTQLDNYADCDASGAGLLKMGQFDGALGMFNRSLQLNPNNATAHDNLGLALAQLGRTNDALQQQETALHLQPNNSQFHNDLGQSLLKAGRRQEAVEQFRKALDLNPDMADPYFNIGLTDLESGDLNHARENFEQALRLAPDHVEASSNLGAVLAQLGKTEEAIRHLQEAVTRNPDNAQAHNNLGNVYLQSGNVPEAITQYEATLKLQLNKPRTWANLAQAYAAANRSHDAIAAAQKAIEIARSQGDRNLAENVDNWLNGYQHGRQ